MESGEIQTCQLTASKSKIGQSHDDTPVDQSRLNAASVWMESGREWGFSDWSEDQWLEVDLGIIHAISGIIAQGKVEHDEWVSKIALYYSLDDRIMVRHNDSLTGDEKVKF